MAQEMETFAARLASFDRVLYPEKRRSSITPAEPIAWPHSRPSPAELAHAGFFYHPYETNPDNTICFLCRRALDGWEEEDNPITEHLKHAPDCGWAVMMDIQQRSSNPAEIEDPTGERIVQARQATFGETWPHDGKRGWTCQSDKMVEGGWYFCPNEESNDLATCAYCKLSLDGWEPKDDPFDEHYRRSSDCSFFVFALPPTSKKAKNSRSKKARVSKASRLSTQSTVSEAPMPEVDDLMDQSTKSQSTTKSKSSKKSSKSKSKSKKKDEQVEAGSQMDVDSADQPPPEPTKAKRTRSKKRTSEDLAKDDTHIDAEDEEKPEPPAKKRATKSRVSAQQQEHDEQSETIAEDVAVEEIHEEERPKKSRSTSKKKTAAKGRNVSVESSTSKVRDVSEAPQEPAPDAVSEVDKELEKASIKEPSEEPAPKPSKKSKSKKKTKPAPEPSYDTEEHSVEVEPQPEEPEPHLSPEPQPPAEEPPVQESPVQEIGQTRRSSRRQSARRSDPVKAEPQEDVVQDIQDEPEEAHIPETAAPSQKEIDTKRHESFVSVEIMARAPSMEPEAEVEEKNGKRKLKRKGSTEKQKKPKKSVERSAEHVQEDRTSPEIEETVLDMDGQTLLGQPEQEEPQVQTPVQQTARRRSSKVPPKTVERYSDIPKEKQYATSLVEARNSNAHQMSGDVNTADDDEQEPETVSPLPSPSKTTPSLSPQSSDAENHPPSLKPSLRPPSSRLHVPSPSKQQSVRVPFAACTPSPSKRAANTGLLSTAHPWTPIDIDSIILAGTSDKENIDFSGILNSTKGELSSPEKKMTVEEWIKWNAKNGEERLKRECERLVSQFEQEGARAMRVLEGIECMD
ncbi:baculoviral IAP repeat-containing protein [Aspergillus homomorphus CBS 101889]|uniref:BIR-domain-containing protein n=1 Tax=Aspergillus homomorphus (strain CBS 101889) TaxID=1450537 RepID=A0A395HZS1_ASPHC|nr:hypothetical protein BO97DRAFT_389379 [Aspergillus homomorphus CBS 101889]RAL12929.1 hypothetical protein BO97DRAFT_389379 [Aspergillus homomorphus CBS 101889]